MSFPFDWFGYTVSEESAPMPGAVGVVIGETRLTNKAFREGQRLANAGAKGVPVSEVMKFDVDQLVAAGHVVERDAFGMSYVMTSELRAPDKYLIERKAKAEMKEKPFITAGWTGTQ